MSIIIFYFETKHIFIASIIGLYIFSFILYTLSFLYSYDNSINCYLFVYSIIGNIHPSFKYNCYILVTKVYNSIDICMMLYLFLYLLINT